MMRRETWRLTEGLIFMHVAVYFLIAANPEAASTLYLFPQGTRESSLDLHYFSVRASRIAILVFLFDADPLGHGSPA